MMQDEAIADYVKTALSLHDLELDEARRAAVTEQFRLLAALARTVLEQPLPTDVDPADMFRL